MANLPAEAQHPRFPMGPTVFPPVPGDGPQAEQWRDLCVAARKPAQTLKDTLPQPAPAARHLADDGNREQYPLFDGLFAYFPAALLEVARWSKIGNDKHNPGQRLHWAREKSIDHENKILRHLLDARQVDEHGIVEAVALAWRALALCQTILEERGAAEGANARRGVRS